MTRPDRIPGQRGSAAEAVRHLVINLSTSLGHLVDRFGAPADHAKYRTFESGAEEVAQRLAHHEAQQGPIAHFDRLFIGGSLSANPKPRKR
ncbi:MAG: hypothetical protein K2X44_05935 [Magnetospirillum sp.]|nr:hypothetical protein [Magnetospirillum sp.]